MTELENKIERLPDGVEMVLYQRSLHPYHEPITTDELKSLTASLKAMRETGQNLLDICYGTLDGETNLDIATVDAFREALAFNHST